MKKLLKFVFGVVLLVTVIYIYRDTWGRLVARFFPCRTPIAYSLGEFDERFGISRENFLEALSDAEKIWESPISKDLFVYRAGGDLKINLIYDIRQEATSKLKSLGFSLNNDQATYDTLKARYDSLQAQYSQQKKSFDLKVAQFESEKTAYEKEVALWQRRGGKVNQETYDRLAAENDRLNAEVKEINSIQESLNLKVDEINALASVLNDLAASLNIKVNQFNTIGSSLGGEFEEGTYESGSDGEKINVYQFESESKLVRVLAHEFGHALGLDHVEDSKAIMYRLNNGVNEKLTNADLVELKNLCGIK